MKKAINIILTVMFVLLLGLAGYRAYLYVKKNNEVKDLKEKTELLSLEIEENKETITNLQSQVEEAKTSNSDLYEKFAIWQRQNQKLKDILAQD